MGREGRRTDGEEREGWGWDGGGRGGRRESGRLVAVVARQTPPREVSVDGCVPPRALSIAVSEVPSAFVCVSAKLDVKRRIARSPEWI